VLYLTTNLTPVSLESIVIEVNGDCTITGEKIAYEHGYRYVRQVGLISFLMKLK
jgi:hypothetical protein